MTTARQGLDAADAGVRVAALGALDRLGVLDDHLLAAQVDDPDASVRRRAVELAARRPEIDLSPWLGDAEAIVVEMAAWASGEREAVPANVLDTLIGLAGGSGLGHEPLVREAAVAALGALGDDEALDAILARRPTARRSAAGRCWRWRPTSTPTTHELRRSRTHSPALDRTATGKSAKPPKTSPPADRVSRRLTRGSPRARPATGRRARGADVKEAS